MKALVSGALLLALLVPASATWASACEGQTAGLSRSPEISAWATGAESFDSSPHFLGTQATEALSLNAVLLRRQLAGCGPSDQYAGYVPRTEHDNTPWRFNMEAGKKLSAAEFDAWMKSRGVRVAKGRAEPAAELAAPAAAVVEATVVQ